LANKDTSKDNDWLRRAVLTFVTAGGLAGRASNHTMHVVEQLGRAIVAGEYPPKTMIPLDPDICEMFDVSRTVVREAKKTLIAKGLIQSKAKVGTHVRQPNEWNMFDEDVLRWHAHVKKPNPFYDELFEIRLIFEPAAAANAASNAKPADCTELYRLCDMLAQSANRADFATVDTEFHKQVLRLSGNRFLQSLGDLVQTALYSLFMIEAKDSFSKRKSEAVAAHRAITDAIASGVPARAHEAMETVIRNGYSAGIKDITVDPGSQVI